MSKYSFLLDVMNVDQLEDSQEKVNLSLACVRYQLDGNFFDHDNFVIEEMTENCNELQELWLEINDEIHLRNDELNIPDHDPQRMHEGVERMIAGMAKKKREDEEKEWAALFSEEDLMQMELEEEFYTMAGNPVEVDGIDHEGFRSPFLILNLI